MKTSKKGGIVIGIIFLILIVAGIVLLVLSQTNDEVKERETSSNEVSVENPESEKTDIQEENNENTAEGNVDKVPAESEDIELFKPEKVIMADFEVNDLYFLSSEEETMMATVTPQKLPEDMSESSIVLCVDGATLCVEMRDDGENHDSTAGDGTYTAEINVSELETGSHNICVAYYLNVENEVLGKYFQEQDNTVLDNSSLAISEEKIIAVFDKLTDESFIEADTFRQDMMQNIAELIDEEGYVAYENVVKVVNKCGDYLAVCKEEGKIIDYDVSDSSIYVKLLSGIPLVYTPSVKGLLANDYEVEGHIYCYKPAENDPITDSEVYTYVADSIADLDSRYVREQDLANAQVTVKSMRDLLANSVILWIGHGGYVQKQNISYLCLQEKYQNTSLYHKELMKNDVFLGIDGAGGKNFTMCITSRFVDSQLKEGQLENSFIYISACHSGRDKKLAQSFLNKGATTVVASSNAIISMYAGCIMRDTLEEMMRMNKDTLRYPTIGESLTKAKQKWGETDVDWQIDKEDDKIDGNQKIYNIALFKLLQKEKWANKATQIIFGDENFSLIFEHGTLYYKVVDKDNNPLESVTVSAYKKGQTNGIPVLTGKTDESGKICLYLFDTEEYTVVFEKDGYLEHSLNSIAAEGIGQPKVISLESIDSIYTQMFGEDYKLIREEEGPYYSDDELLAEHDSFMALYDALIAEGSEITAERLKAAHSLWFIVCMDNGNGTSVNDLEYVRKNKDIGLANFYTVISSYNKNKNITYENYLYFGGQYSNARDNMSLYVEKSQKRSTDVTPLTEKELEAEAYIDKCIFTFVSNRDHLESVVECYYDFSYAETNIPLLLQYILPNDREIIRTRVDEYYDVQLNFDNYVIGSSGQ